MNNITKSKRLIKKVTDSGRKAKNVVGIRKSKKVRHKQNSIYGQYLIQESKDIDRTIKSLERILIQ